MSLLGFACAAALVPLGLAAAWRRADWRYGLAGLPQPIGRVLGFPGCDTSKHRVRFAEVLSVWSGPRDRRLCLATPGLR